MDIRNIISQMTLEEKAGILSGNGMWFLKAVERLGVPGVMVTDGPHGLRKQAGAGDHLGLNASVVSICFPTAASLASSFDRDLVNQVGQALGDECQAENVAVILGPGANIKRSPLCGRNFEYFSEDPYLTGEIAAAHISGVQSKNVGTSLKHFAANNQEDRRMMVDTIVDERTLREIYLAGFEKAVKAAKPWTVMGSYNLVNGLHATENPHLLSEILRDEWGFDGYVVTDWGAMCDKLASLKAGLDLQMPGDHAADKKLVQGVLDGKVDEALLDQAVERILTITDRYLSNKVENAKFDYEGHHALARKVESEAAVLLKNEGVLPVSAGKKIALIGKFAEIPGYQGGGSSHINSWAVTSAVEAFRDYDGEVAYAQGYITEKDEVSAELAAAAVKAAAAADVAIVFAGMPAGFESEGFDRKHLDLPSCQNALISEIAGANPNTVVILNNSSAITMPWLGEVAAVIEGYLGGEAVGGAMFDIVTGKVNPSGKLAETFPLRLEDTPAYLNFPGYNDRVEYREGIYVGYRWYDARKMDVLFPFGFGLSYTTFEYSNLHIDKEAMTDAETVAVTCDITNTGNVFGKEAVQLYVTRKTDGIPRAVRELKGFEKVALEPGETKTVSFTLCKRAFAYYNVDINAWYVEDGVYGVEIAASSRDIRLEGELKVSPVKPVVRPFTLDSSLGEMFSNPVAAAVLGQLMAGFGGANAGDKKEGDDAMGVDVAAMMSGIPMRAMIGFSGGAFSEEMALGLLAQINAAL